MTQRNLRWTAVETDKVTLADPSNINSTMSIKRGVSQRIVGDERVTVVRNEFKAIKPVRTVLGEKVVSSTPSATLTLSNDQYTKTDLTQMIDDLYRNAKTAIQDGALDGFIIEPGAVLIIDGPLISL